MEILGFNVPLWAVILLVTLVVLYRMATKDLDIFVKMGIPGPKPLPFLGNMFSFMTHGLVHYDRTLYKKYGKVLGMFFGAKPILMIGDPEMVKEITVKKFESFRNRETVKMGVPVLDSMVTSLQDDHWKHVRRHLTPTFSASKLRRVFFANVKNDTAHFQMVPLLNKCCGIMVKNLAKNAKTGDSFEAREFCGYFSMDAIASSAFGLDVDSQNDNDNIFVKRGKEIMSKSPVITIIVISLFPWSLPILTRLFGLSLFVNEKALNFFNDIVERTMKEREQNPDKDAKDFLQLMIDSKTTPEEYEEDNPEAKIDTSKMTWSRSGLTQDEIVANSFVFFLGGYVNNLHSLSFAIYNMAVNPDAQDKAYEEVKRVLGDKDPDYDDLKKLDYLSMCVDETLRMFPATTLLQRQANEDVEVGGIQIPKGMRIFIPSYAMQNDPEIWSEPEKFIPERFSAEAKEDRNSGYYTPFGMGPRQCIAERLSLLQTKLALAHIIRAYRLVTCEKTKIPVKLQKFKMESESGLWIKVEARN